MQNRNVTNANENNENTDTAFPAPPVPPAPPAHTCGACYGRLQQRFLLLLQWAIRGGSGFTYQVEDLGLIALTSHGCLPAGVQRRLLGTESCITARQLAWSVRRT